LPVVPGCGRRGDGRRAGAGDFQLEDSMADHREVEYATAAGNDYAEHEKTYELFIWLVKLHLIVLPLLLLGMWYFLV
jgi:hypothetical protein